MKFLVDENLSPRVAALLRDSGTDATHIFDHNLAGASDADVSTLAVAERRTIVSADSDFSTLLALSGGTAPIITVRLVPPVAARHRGDGRSRGSVTAPGRVKGVARQEYPSW